MATTAPSWFNESVYMANKLKQLQASEPNANWTEASMNQAFTESGYGAGNAYQHFLDHGQAEDISPVAEFNVSEYYTAKAIDFFKLPAGTMPTAAQYDEIVKIIHDVYPQGGAWEHYQRHGMEEGTNPSNGFDASGYMDAKLALMQAGDLAYTMDQLVAAFEAAGYTPMSHYLMHKGGQGEVATDAKFTVPTGEQVTPPADPGVPGGEFRLTADQDAITGTAANDTFIANIFDNQNTLQSGDYINGGAGTDTLKADLGTSNNFVITPETESVEVVKFRVQADIDDEITTPGDNNIGHAHIDAERMEGVKEFWSSNSRADLVIEDIRINSNQITIGMENTDAGDVDYSVFFDPQHLTAKDAVATGSVLNLQLMDTRSAVAGGDPLLNNPYSGFVFSLDGKLITVKSPAIDAATTYDQLLVAIEAAVKATPGLENFTVQFGPDFPARDTVSGDTAIGQTIQLVNNGAGTISTDVAGTGWVSDSPVPPSSGLHTDMSPDAPVGDHPLIQTNVVLDNVGRVNWNPNNDPANNDYGSEAGNLLIGSMAERGGVERFDVEVKSGSWLNSMSSTNDTLENVTVKEGSKGNLYIGGNGDDSMTSWTDAPIYLETGGLTNVLTFDASKLGEDDAGRNDVKLHVDITDGAFDKYLNKIDTDLNADPTDDDVDNADFVYTTGSGDDALDFHVDGNVIADSDASLTIDTGAGDDNIRLDFTANEENGNWQMSQHGLDNVVISAGAGDDTIKTIGSGHVIINAGSGEDTVYADNSGNKAVYVLNANGDPNSRLVTYDPIRGMVSANDIAANNTSFNFGTAAGTTAATVTVTVTYHGISGTFAIPVTSFNADGTFSLTDLEVNQAIKNAINSDPELSKLMVAKDGAGHSLILEALVDGAGDLQIGFGGTYGNDLPVTGAGIVDMNGAYDEQLGTSDLNGTVVNGTNSDAHSDNTIDGGTGNDVLILGTGAHSNDRVVFSGEFGTDTLVNFSLNHGVAGGDYLDFSAYFTGLRADGTNLEVLGEEKATTANTVFVLNGGLAADGTAAIKTVADLTAALADNGSFDGVNTLNSAAGQYVFMIYNVDTGNYDVFTATSAQGSLDFTGIAKVGSIDLGSNLSVDDQIDALLGNKAIFHKWDDADTSGGTTGTAVVVSATGSFEANVADNQYFLGTAAAFEGNPTLKGTATSITLSDAAASNAFADFTTTSLGDADIQTIKLANVANTVSFTAGSSALYDFVGGTDVDIFAVNAVYGKTINAGAGDDIFNVTVDAQTGIFNGDAGNDTFDFTVAPTTGTFNGGAGDDTFTFTAAATAAMTGTFDGGVAGTDIFELSAGGDISGATVTGFETLDISAAAANAVTMTAEQYGQFTTITGAVAHTGAIIIENALGTIAKPVDLLAFTGSNSSNYTLSVAGDNVVKVAGAGAFKITGQGGNDTIIGGDGVDTIDTGAGTNTVTGGAGNDVITLGAGVDTVMYSLAANNGVDAITAFTSTSDKLNIQGLDSGTLTLAGSAITTAAAKGGLTNLQAQLIQVDGTAASLTSGGSAVITDWTDKAQVTAFLTERFTVAANDASVFVLTDTNDATTSYVYAFKSTDAAMDAGDFTYVGTVGTNVQLAIGDIAVA